MRCPICDQIELSADEATMQACCGCAAVVGLVPMPPVTRPAKACSCGGRKFLRAIPREHATPVYRQQISAPMLMTHPLRRSEGLLGSSAEAVDPSRGWGRLEMFACYGCGKVEWFCSDVTEVPIHPHLMTDVVEYDAGGPFR